MRYITNLLNNTIGPKPIPNPTQNTSIENYIAANYSTN